MDKKIWLYLFFVDALLNLYAETIQNISLIYISKPLLMILLALHFYSNKRGNSLFERMILWGLFFSFLGDTFLMIRETGATAQQFFLLGLGSFLITHVFYIIAFGSKGKNKGYLFRKPLIVLPFLLFLFGNAIYLFPDLPGGLKFPVLLYSTIITLMGLSCMNLKDIVASDTFSYLIIGVVLFMFSDMLIGLGQFKKESVVIPLPRISIMLTYILAQFLIVTGSLKLLEEEK